MEFLDLLIANNGDNFLASVFCKKDSIGLYTYYLSFMHFLYKIGPLHHEFVICSNWSIFHLELSKAKELLEKNLYPSNFVADR